MDGQAQEKAAFPGTFLLWIVEKARFCGTFARQARSSCDPTTLTRCLKRRFHGHFLTLHTRHTSRMTHSFRGLVEHRKQSHHGSTLPASISDDDGCEGETNGGCDAAAIAPWVSTSVSMTGKFGAGEGNRTLVVSLGSCSKALGL